MKHHSTKKLSISVIIFLVLLLVFHISCQKEISPGADIMKAEAAANSSIVYTDVAPDIMIAATHVQSGSYSLDLNNDNISDFNLIVYWNGSTSAAH